MVCAGAALSGCNSGPYYPVVDQSHGGTRARVMTPLSAWQAMQAQPACIDAAAMHAAGNWVKAEFRRDRMRSAVVALAPASLASGINDQVELQPEFCADGRLFHVVKILHAQINPAAENPTP